LFFQAATLPKGPQPSQWGVPDPYAIYHSAWDIVGRFDPLRKSLPLLKEKKAWDMFRRDYAVMPPVEWPTGSGRSTDAFVWPISSSHYNPERKELMHMSDITSWQKEYRKATTDMFMARGENIEFYQVSAEMSDVHIILDLINTGMRIMLFETSQFKPWWSLSMAKMENGPSRTEIVAALRETGGDPVKAAEKLRAFV